MLFIPTVGAGGAERVVSLMANYWVKKGYDIVVLSLDNPNNEPFFRLHKNVNYEPLGLLREKRGYLGKVKRTISQIITTRKRVHQIQPDVIIAQLDIAIFLAMTSTIYSKIKAIVYEGNNPYLNITNKYLQKVNNFLYRFTDHLVLQTQQIAKTFPSYLQDKISVIYNPVTTPPYQLNHEDCLRNLQRKKITCVGRLEHQKGYDVLIRAFHLFSQHHPDWSLEIWGEGRERSKLEQLCEEKGISDRVLLPGNIKNPYDQLLKSSVFVLSSRFEGLPNVLLEAMSVGMPVIATRCKFGPEEIIQHRQNGLLVPTEDAEAIADALVVLADDPKLCKQLGQNARKINNKLHVDKIMEQWEDVINSL